MKQLLLLIALALTSLTSLASPTAAQGWGRGLIPGDSVRAQTTLGPVHGRFVMWSDSLLTLSDTALARGAVTDVEVWKKRDPGTTLAVSLLYGAGVTAISYAIEKNDPPNHTANISFGTLAAIGGYALAMILTPGKWRAVLLTR